MKVVKTENERDIKLGAVKRNGFSGAVRSLEMNNLRDGDVVTLPEGEYDVLEQKIRNSDNTFEYINVNVQRGESATVARLTPSLFWRNLEEADADGNGTGVRHIADGNVVEAVQGFATVDEFIAAHKGEKFAVKMNPQFMAVGFNGQKPRKASVPTLTWVG